MSGIATAMVAGAVVTGVAAKNAADTAAGAANSELAFAQQQYNDWMDVYGPVQDNLSNYYSNLSPETFAAQGIQYAEEAFATALEQTNTNLAQRGITDSGIAADVQRQGEYQLAETKASIRQEAPAAVAAQQQSFLSVGMGNNPSNNLQSVLSNNANRTYSESVSANNAFGSSVSSALSYGLNALNSSSSAGTGVSGSTFDTSGGILAGTPTIDYTTGLA